jgi:hypothetical protein
MHTLASPTLPLAGLVAVLRRLRPVALAEAVAGALAALFFGPTAVDTEIAFSHSSDGGP